jgi:Family of unknown function (DUF6941)
MRVTMMLADHAQVADGKLFVSGGGWSVCGPGPVACAVALLFHVPWQRTNERIGFALRLLDEDGMPVSQPGPAGGQEVQAAGQFEAGRPAGLAPGTEINVPIVFNTVLQLAPGQRFTWVLEVGGQVDEAWRLSFATRETQPSSHIRPG